MAAISSLIAATAVAASVAGTGAAIYGQQKASAAQGAAAQGQAQTAGLQSIAADFQSQALGVQQRQQQLQIGTQKTAIQLQQQSDDVRRQAATLDATRRQREIVRQGLIASSASLVTATAQGASASGSSAAGGAKGQISGRTNVNSLGISQNLALGNSIFDINKAISSNYLSGQDQNSALVAEGGALQSNILAVQKKIYDIGGNTSLSYKDAAAAGGISAFGTGLSSLGGSLVKNQETIDKIGTYFSGAFGSSAASSYKFPAQPTDI